MPWTTDSPPDVAKNWPSEDIEKCVAAANSVLDNKGTDEEAIFACIRAAGHSESMMSQHHFLFTELNADVLTPGKYFDGLAFGTFRDMFGREVTLDPDDAPDYVANTIAAIEVSKTISGELVGLPIDSNGHDKGDGAGWLVGVKLVGGIIQFLPNWTEIGRELISKGIRRFFSATIDTANKVIIGGTLTNWPAIRDDNNRVMLRPIELESRIFIVEEQEPETEPISAAPLESSRRENMPDEIIEPQETPPETPPKTEPPREEPPRAEPVLAPDVTAELMREFAEAGKQEPIQIVEAIQRKADELARLHVEDMMEKRQRELEITQLASQYVGGRKYGLPVGTIDLARFLDSLDDAQYEIAKSIFDSITQSGVVEFTERGHGKRLRKRQLPAEYHAALKGVLDAGNSIDDFFNAVDLGEPAEYDLSSFIGGNNG